jgi:hypothetical protein
LTGNDGTSHVAPVVQDNEPPLPSLLLPLEKACSAQISARADAWAALSAILNALVAAFE